MAARHDGCCRFWPRIHWRVCLHYTSRPLLSQCVLQSNTRASNAQMQPPICCSGIHDRSGVHASRRHFNNACPIHAQTDNTRCARCLRQRLQPSKLADVPLSSPPAMAFRVLVGAFKCHTPRHSLPPALHAEARFQVARCSRPHFSTRPHPFPPPPLPPLLLHPLNPASQQHPLNASHTASLPKTDIGKAKLARPMGACIKVGASLSAAAPSG